VTDLTPLKGLRNLRWLNLQETGVTDLTPLKGMSNLYNLDISNTKVTDLTPLKGMHDLWELDISNTRVTDLSPLRGAPQLHTLIANHVPNLKSLDPLMNHKMDRLEIGGTAIAKEAVLEFIASQPELVSLGLAGMAITDTDLATLLDRSYHTLDLSSTKVTDLSGINCSALSELKISNTSIKVLPPDLAYLETLEICHTKLDPGELLRLPKLCRLKLTVDPTNRELVGILEKLPDSCRINDLSKDIFLKTLKEK
jgi:Leucine-rich repeat (LRR) protein